MKTNKCLYLTFQPIAKADGVSKKVFAQKDALNELGINTSIIYPKINDKYEYSFFLNDKLIIEKIKHSRISSFIFSSSFYNSLFDVILQEKTTFLYIRYCLSACPVFLNFLKKCKKNGIKIFLEIATYPYDNEIKSYRAIPAKLIEKYYRKFLHNYIDRIITYTDLEYIYNIKTINISNAAPNSLPLRINKHEINSKIINLIVVANISLFHGIDRLIEGFKIFYEKKNEYEVFLNIVGESIANKEAQKLRQLVKLYNLEKYICFCGPKDGYELNELFNKSDLAIGCLGCHRKNISKLKSLKNVEYAVRGIPFIYSETNDDFDNQFYIKKFPENEEAINVEDICHFIKNNTFNPQDIRNSITHLTWNFQMNKILSEFYKLNL